MSGEKKRWIQSYTGLQVFPLDLKPEQIALVDIAHALSMKCRFTGHVREFYSVGQHTILGAHCLANKGASLSKQLAFLLHEVSEAYLPDIAKPIKDRVAARIPGSWDGWPCTGVWDWEALELTHARVIFKALELLDLLHEVYSDEVKQMDLAMLAAEKEQLFSTPEPAPWGLPEPAAKVHIFPDFPPIVYVEWLRLYRGLRGRYDAGER